MIMMEVVDYVIMIGGAVIGLVGLPIAGIVLACLLTFWQAILPSVWFWLKFIRV